MKYSLFTVLILATFASVFGEVKDSSSAIVVILNDLNKKGIILTEGSLIVRCDARVHTLELDKGEKAFFGYAIYKIKESSENLLISGMVDKESGKVYIISDYTKERGGVK